MYVFIFRYVLCISPFLGVKFHPEADVKGKTKYPKIGFVLGDEFKALLKQDGTELCQAQTRLT